MRQVLSLSLPVQDTRQIKISAKNRGFNSASAYVRYLLKLDMELISAESLWRSAQEARKEYKAGKTATAKSMADLL